MKRNSLNFIVDLSALAALLGLGFSGFIIRQVLPPGSGGLGRLLHDGRGREQIRTLWSLSRHEWGTVHYYLAVLFLFLVLAHLVLHWNWIKCYFLSVTASPQKTDPCGE